MAEEPNNSATTTVVQEYPTGGDNLGRLTDVLGDGAESTEEAERTPATAVEDETAEPQETEGAEATAEGDTESSEEESLLPTEDETDFSDEVYQRHAARYKRNFGVDLDVDDPAHRILLREIIQRGQALERARAAQDETEAVDDTAAATQAQPATAGQPTADQIRQRIEGIADYVSKKINPDAAISLTTDFLKAVYPKEYAAGKLKVTPEYATGITKFFFKWGTLMQLDTLPDLLAQNLPGMIQHDFPMLGNIHEERIEESAIELLESMKDAAGKPLYADLEDLVESGAITRVMKENPQIREMSFKDRKTGRVITDPVRLAAERQKFAIRLARADGHRGGANRELVSRAVATGKRQASAAAQRAANGRLGAGESQGGFASGPSAKDELMAGLVSGGEGKLAAAVRHLDERRRK